VNQEALKPLDLTDSSTARVWRYNGGEQTPEMKVIGAAAARQGYNAIRFPSVRLPGTNNIVILRDFNTVLKPVMVTPTTP
jgi:filamentous hemagglutinin